MTRRVERPSATDGLVLVRPTSLARARRLGALLAPSAALAVLLLTGCEGESTPPEDAGAIEGGALDGSDGRGDAGPIGDDSGAPDGGSRDGAAPDGGDCGPDCPPGSCIDGVCSPTDCCWTGECPAGFSCDWDSCGCVPASGCCASGGSCPTAGDVCSWDCTCVSGDDCRYWGCPSYWDICDDTTGACTPDTSCGDCGPERHCVWGTCTHPCWLGEVTCGDGLLCSETEGCVAARCSDAECAALEPPQRCDPSVGCSDPCLGGDWSWCTAMGGRCYLGTCVDDSCSANAGVGCHYRHDCCGDSVCQRDDAAEPTCTAPCSRDPYEPPRADLCRCQAAAEGCIDVFGGGPIVFPPGPVPF